MGKVELLETAAQRALRIPEIVENVLAQVLPPHPVCKCPPRLELHSLQACACVNKLWNAWATEKLWWNPCFSQGDDIMRALLRVEPSRRQLYASLIEEGIMSTIVLLRVQSTVPEMASLKFPRLRAVRLMVWFPAGCISLRYETVSTLIFSPVNYRGWSNAGAADEQYFIVEFLPVS
ncbi:hypothetical protein KEM55_003370 [Ascosphaera atra]|nr:hypothetical protein KEM55_003370 [Ascosphaera atra]